VGAERPLCNDGWRSAPPADVSQNLQFLERDGRTTEPLQRRAFWTPAGTGFMERPAWSYSIEHRARGLLAGTERVSYRSGFVERVGGVAAPSRDQL